MRRYTGATLVIKYGGHAMGDERLAQMFARDVVLLKQVGINPIVVHGGGPQIGAHAGAAEDRERVRRRPAGHRRKAPSRSSRWCCPAQINKRIVAAIGEAGGRGVGLSGKDGNLMRAKKLTRTKKDPNSNIEEVLDLGFVGEPAAVDPGHPGRADRVGPHPGGRADRVRRRRSHLQHQRRHRRGDPGTASAAC